MSSGLTGLTGFNRGILFQKQKSSLFMVKVKTIFCIVCVCSPLFTSQHSLSWDMRLWPLLGGTTRTQWFSNNSLSSDDKKKGDVVIINAIMNLMTTRQRDDEDLTDYTKCFKAVSDLCKEKYGGIFNMGL